MGIDTYTYQVSDGLSVSNFGNVTLAVGITSLPRAVPDAYEMQEEETLTVGAGSGVLVNDTDADTPHEELQAFLVGYDECCLDVVLAADGSFTGTPRTNFSGETFFIYQVYDGTSVSNAARVDITVLPVNDGVEANDDVYGVVRNTVFETKDRSPGTIVTTPLSGHSKWPCRHVRRRDLNQQTGRFRYTRTDFSAR